MERLLILALSVGLWCDPVFAEDWIALRQDNEAGLTLYLDRNSISRKGANIEARFLFNFKSLRTTDDEHKRSYRSIADYNVVNCKDETIASAGQDIYAEEMGQGKLVSSFRVKAKDIFPVDVATENAEAKFKSVCPK